jgi:hypothetical protein
VRERAGGTIETKTGTKNVRRGVFSLFGGRKDADPQTLPPSQDLLRFQNDDSPPSSSGNMIRTGDLLFDPSLEPYAAQDYVEKVRLRLENVMVFRFLAVLLTVS